jgi:hypothetical protein
MRKGRNSERLSNHLGVAASRNVAQPQALLAVVIHDVEDVFAVGRDGDDRRKIGYFGPPSPDYVNPRSGFMARGVRKCPKFAYFCEWCLEKVEYEDSLAER